jgi:hypothetical protein
MIVKNNPVRSAIAHRSTTLALGGVLTAGDFATAVANADDYIYFSGADVDPVVSEEGFPPFYEEVAGPQLYNVADATTQTPIGTFEANTYDAYILGLTNTQFVVTADLTGTNEPSVGSAFDDLTFGTSSSSAITNVYSDVVGASGNTITDALDTPWGDFNIPTTFDAAFFLDAENGFDAPAAAADVSPLLDLLSTL